MINDKLPLPVCCLLFALVVTVIVGCQSSEGVKEVSESVKKDKPVDDTKVEYKADEVERLKETLKKDPTLWRERHKLGVTYMTGGKYQEAVEEFIGVLSVKPDSVEAFQSLGMAYYRMGKNHLAISYWRSALEIQPENKLIWRLVRQLEDQNPDIAKSVELSHKDIETKNKDIDIDQWTEHYKKGQDYYANNDNTMAIEEFEMAAKYNPLDYRTYFSMGAAYNAKGDMEGAIANWRKSLRLKPDDLMIMKLVTLAKTRKERETELKKVEALVQKEPENWKAHERLASLYTDTKSVNVLNKAADEYKKVLRLYAEYTPAYLKLAEISFTQGRYDDGLEYLNEGLKFQPENEKLKRQIEIMTLYKDLYQIGREEWETGGIERYKEMVLVEEGPNSFYIDKYEVTNAQYKEFLDDNPQYRLPHHWKSGTYRKGRDNYPVVNVDWYMANVYCKTVGKRLPVEEEWERAAGGTDGRVYPWGNRGLSLFTDEAERSRRIGTVPMLLVNSKESEFEDLTPVGVFKEGASPYGAYDMAGNAEEWTLSEYKAEESKDNESQLTQTYKVRRGGSFRSDRTALILTNRAIALPTDTDESVGFRCVKDTEYQQPMD